MAYFQLIDKGTGEPARFNGIDEKLCSAFHAEVDEDKYFRGWYDIVGLCFCMGGTWEKLRKIYEADPADDEMLAVINWLEGRYEAEAWR